MGIFVGGINSHVIWMKDKKFRGSTFVYIQKKSMVIEIS